MVIVSLQGRLGNQMFEYALYKCLQSKGREVYLDLACNRQHDEQKGIIADIKYNLGIFQPDYQIADEEIVKEWLHDKENRNLWKRWEYRIFPERCSYYEEKKTGTLDRQVFRLDDVYLCGYWQSEKYFTDIKDEIRNIYEFPNLFTDYQRSVLDKVSKGNSVSVHIRRGDYLQCPEIYGTIDKKYYQDAMRYLEERIENLHFFFFTDDIVWAKQNYTGKNITIIEDNADLLSNNLDMALMAACSHNIIANSSFSWWGAWLNRNPRKTVIAPQRWEVGKKMPDIWAEGWIKI